MPRIQVVPLVWTALVWALVSADAAAQNAGMGGTFDAIAASALEIRTVFRDAHAITQRDADGHLDTVLYDENGKPLVSLRRNPQQPFIDVGAPGGGWRHRVTLAKDTSYAPDWNNAQAYLLWRDTKALGHSLAASSLPPIVFEGKLLRVKRARDEDKRRGTPIDLDAETQSVQTRFPSYVALATRRPHRPNLRPDGVYATFTSRLQSNDGTTLGYIRFFARERIVSWTFTNGERGIAREERIPGGFKFTPNMAWANVQAVWFHEHPPQKPAPAAALAAGTLPTCGAATPAAAPARNVQASIAQRLLSWMGGVRFLPSIAAVGGAPRVTALSLPSLGGRSLAGTPAATTDGAAAQQPCDGLSDGCTGLHWLDNTIFRQCCDRHDICFEKSCPDNPACTAWSWIKFWDRWECTKCNIAAVFCFATFGGGGGDGGGGGGGGGGSGHDWCWSDMDCPDGYICEWDGVCRSWFDYL